MPLINYLWCDEPYLLCLEIAVITPMLRENSLSFLLQDLHLPFASVHVQISVLGLYTVAYAMGGDLKLPT